MKHGDVYRYTHEDSSHENLIFLRVDWALDWEGGQVWVMGYKYGEISIQECYVSAKYLILVEHYVQKR